MIVIDIVTDITDVETLRAAKPEIQSIMPTDQNKIDSWWEDTLIKNTERLTKRHFGYLKEKSKALHKAKQLVENNKNIGIRVEYGSTEVNEKDFVEDEE
jgi:hypothetical protein